MATKTTTIALKIADLAATVSGPDTIDGRNYLMALSEALWERATQQASPEVTALFSAYIEVEALITWLEGCHRNTWLGSPEIDRSNVNKNIQKALAIFGDPLDEVLEPHLEEVGLLQE